MKRAAATLLSITAIAATVACGNDATTTSTGATSSRAASATTTTADPTTAEPTTTTPAPTTIATPQSLPLGQTYETTSASVTVYAVDQNAAPTAPAPESPNAKWAAVDVQVCAKTAALIANYVWSLVGADNGRYEVSSTGYSQFPTPAFPFGEQQVAAGECIRGWIVFVMPTSGTVAFVRYAPTASGVEPMRWQV